jgi:hypothetical protein
MGTDDLFKKERTERKSRVSKEKEKRAETWLFVCEGTKTEPNYFDSLMKYANSKSNRKIKYKIEGTGRNTESLVTKVEDYFSCVDEININVNIPYGKIFAVFDKDSFKKNQFNNAIHTATKKGYIPIWSNECIELWFILHFDLLVSNVTRQEYFDKLGQIFKCSYDKTANHFEMLDSENNLKTAVKNAKKLFDKTNNFDSFADKSPCTTVFILIEKIESTLGIKL